MNTRREWTDRCASICRGHRDLVAVYESRSQFRWGLLLRHTMVPLPEERLAWLCETRRIARAAILDLRDAGLSGGFVVLQWRALGEVASILDGWVCRYEADGDRRRELSRVVARCLADWQYVSTHRPALEDRPEPATADGDALRTAPGYSLGRAGSGSTV